MDTARRLIEVGALTIEAMAVALIVGAFLWASVLFLVHTRQQTSDRYERYKLSLGRALSLGLEFLVAADVIRQSLWLLHLQTSEFWPRLF